MGTFKRKRTTKKTFRAKKFKVRNTTKKRVLSLQQIGSRLAKLTKTIETKSGVRTIADGTEYLHNNLYTISSAEV